MKRVATLTCFILLLIHSVLVAQDARLLRSPAISEAHVAFAYANDVWIAGLDGGEARRLTTFPGAETQPRFSPDGKTVAFSGQYDGNTDVYVVPVTGGEPRRLTWHPGPDAVRGWTVDGGYITAPRGGFYNLDGEWDVENEGIPPDVEVEMDPKLVNAGHDPQLEAAVTAALEMLKAQSIEIHPQSADPVRSKRPGK